MSKNLLVSLFSLVILVLFCIYLVKSDEPSKENGSIVIESSFRASESDALELKSEGTSLY